MRNLRRRIWLSLLFSYGAGRVQPEASSKTVVGAFYRILNFTIGATVYWLESEMPSRISLHSFSEGLKYR